MKGFGLGLHYVQLIARAHGGEVEVDSVVGKGTTFRLTIPYHGKYENFLS